MKIRRTPKVKVSRSNSNLKQVTFRMTDEMSNNIKELAKKSNLTMSEYLRNILDKSV
jgi:predicted DNA-binding protein